MDNFWLKNYKLNLKSETGVFNHFKTRGFGLLPFLGGVGAT